MRTTPRGERLRKLHDQIRQPEFKEVGGIMYCEVHDDFADERNNGDVCRAFENDNGPWDDKGECRLVPMFVKS